MSLIFVVFTGGCSIYRGSGVDGVPLSQVANELFMRISWDPAEQKAILERGELHIAVRPGDEKVLLGGEEKKMESRAYLHEKEVYIPRSFYTQELKPLALEMEKKYEAVENGEIPSIKLKIEPSRHDLSDFCVVLDAGHGGHDSGAIGLGNLYEKKMTLDIAKKVAAYLRQVGAKVVMVRSEDHYVSLEKRVAIGNQPGKDCFVSIHLNSAPIPSASGFEIWITHNRKASHYSKSMRLAHWIRHYLKAGIPLKDRGIKRSSFRVIHESKIPSVLVECCFVSNANDVRWILQEESREKMARQIYLGIVAYHVSLKSK